MNRMREIAFWIFVVLVVTNAGLAVFGPTPGLQAEALGRAGFNGLVAILLWMLGRTESKS